MFLSNSLLVKLGILKWRSFFNFPASFNQKMILKEENIEGKGHHIGHKYELNFRTTQQEIDTILLVQNYTNPKFNCNLTIIIQSIITKE